MEKADNTTDSEAAGDAEKKLRRVESSEVGVETGTEAMEPDHDIAELTRDMFTKMTAYIRGDLAATAEDYKLLEDMNRLTSKKYEDMKQMAVAIERDMKNLDEKYKNLEPYLAQVDQIEESVLSLEQAALRLDAYARRLEAKFKHLEKR
ncbi:biogenesis of lysosome-related organelles complex 1 subunit 2-like isoform X1 [Acanthaster planci]|uniref:Biogenesis of lysosome-related organelles complex 1 subunit 2-like isoform X1 n=1 Tax=Acanthaster planci TaxID=133434 RepID=A0A8B7Y2R9_ACAPL|nr:biogenesis of lysosome-related organelles complex 1 subunit 2-like isoform X1 [Acanthaster planci]